MCAMPYHLSRRYIMGASNAVIDMPGTKYSEHSIEVPARGQTGEFVVNACGFPGFARPIHEPNSSISMRLWALALAQRNQARRPSG